MVLQSDLEELRLAWRALAGGGKGDGWQTIPIELEGLPNLQAGRYFPGNEEAILVGFKSIDLPPDINLPKGQGFRVEKVNHQLLGDSDVWVSLSRQPAGSLDMFSLMAEDVICMLRTYNNADDQTLFHLFLGRVKAWQEFMQRDRKGVLKPEAEVGLVGELSVLKMIIESRLSVMEALESWHGPLNGLHDFIVGTGAIEVKSTTVSNGFPAIIGSLDQLDKTIVNPLFLAGVRLSLNNSGQTLPEIIAEIFSFLGASPEVKSKFENLLLEVGFSRAFSDAYIRRFKYVSTRFIPVNATFPALTRSTINVAIRKVRYELDLDLLDIAVVSKELVLKELEVL